MTSTRSWIAATLTAASLTLSGWTAPALAQDPRPKDEGLEKLLEKLEEKPSQPGDPKKETTSEKARPSGDEGLEKLLEKIDQKPGQSERPEERRRPRQGQQALRRGRAQGPGP